MFFRDMYNKPFDKIESSKTMITFLFDSGFMWCVNIPVAFLLSRYTGLPIVPLYLVCQLVEIIKCIVGFILVKKGIWIHNLVEEG